MEQFMSQPYMTPLHLAVLRKDLPSVISLVQGKKKDKKASILNAQNEWGLTPLMLAAELGRLQIFSYLISKPATNIGLTDNDGRNLRLYTGRGRRRLLIHRDDATTQSSSYPRASRRGRLEIRKILRNRVALRSMQNRRRSPFSDARLYYSGNEIELHRRSGGPAFVYKAGEALGNKTVGFTLWAGEAKPTVAISGWTSRAPDPDVLNNAEYTSRVRQVAKQVGFTLRAGWNDNGGKKASEQDRGRETGSHVEKQLGVFVVERALRAFCGEGTLTSASLRKLRSTKLPHIVKNSIIYLNHRPCISCYSFLDELGRRAGIRFTVVQVRFLVSFSRRQQCSCGKGKGSPTSLEPANAQTTSMDEPEGGLDPEDQVGRDDDGNDNGDDDEDASRHDEDILHDHELSSAQSSPLQASRANGKQPADYTASSPLPQWARYTDPGRDGEMYGKPVHQEPPMNESWRSYLGDMSTIATAGSKVRRAVSGISAHTSPPPVQLDSRLDTQRDGRSQFFESPGMGPSSSTDRRAQDPDSEGPQRAYGSDAIGLDDNDEADHNDGDDDDDENAVMILGPPRAQGHRQQQLAPTGQRRSQIFYLAYAAQVAAGLPPRTPVRGGSDWDSASGSQTGSGGTGALGLHPASPTRPPAPQKRKRGNSHVFRFGETVDTTKNFDLGRYRFHPADAPSSPSFEAPATRKNRRNRVAAVATTMSISRARAKQRRHQQQRGAKAAKRTRRPKEQVQEARQANIRRTSLFAKAVRGLTMEIVDLTDK